MPKKDTEKKFQFKMNVSGYSKIVATNEDEAIKKFQEWCKDTGENLIIETVECVGEAW